MKKSAKVTLAFLSSFAAATMNGCDNDNDGDWVEAKRCVDNNNVVVEDRMCEASGPASHYHSYYYGGHGYYMDERAYGGGRVAPSRVTYAHPSHISPGGFAPPRQALLSPGTLAG